MRPYEMPFKAITLIPKVDMRKNQYAFVTVDSSGKAIPAPAGKAAIGTLQTPNNVDEQSNVMVQGITFFKCDGAVAAGDLVAVGTEANGKTAVEGSVGVAICIVGAGNGEIGCCLLK